VGLADLRTISLLLIVVLVVLASSSRVFGVDGASVTLTPIIGCPGTQVDLVASFSSFVFAADNNGGIQVSISSNPYGLLSEITCRIEANAGLDLYCTFVVSKSACSGINNVIVTLKGAVDSVSESASASFEVPSTCPGVHSCAAVGGYLEPVNRFGILAPWLAVISVVCISTSVVVAVKRWS
jgi:hypothetical protein